MKKYLFDYIENDIHCSVKMEAAGPLQAVIEFYREYGKLEITKIEKI